MGFCHPSPGLSRLDGDPQGVWAVPLAQGVSWELRLQAFHLHKEPDLAQSAQHPRKLPTSYPAQEPLRPRGPSPLSPPRGSPEPCRKAQKVPGEAGRAPYLISVWPPALRAICTSSFPYRSSAWALQRQPPGTGLVHSCCPKLTLRWAQPGGRVCPCRLWPCRCLLETVRPPALLNKRG